MVYLWLIKKNFLWDKLSCHIGRQKNPSSVGTRCNDTEQNGAHSTGVYWFYSPRVCLCSNRHIALYFVKYVKSLSKCSRKPILSEYGDLYKLIIIICHPPITQHNSQNLTRSKMCFCQKPQSWWCLEHNLAYPHVLKLSESKCLTGQAFKMTKVIVHTIKPMLAYANHWIGIHSELHI